MLYHLFFPKFHQNPIKQLIIVVIYPYLTYHASTVSVLLKHYINAAGVQKENIFCYFQIITPFIDLRLNNVPNCYRKQKGT
jgi:hypothetical protein